MAEHEKSPIKLQHSCPDLGAEEIAACENVLRSGYLASGPETRAFEDELCQRYRRRHAICVASGWAALHLSCHVLQSEFESVAMPSYVCTALMNAVAPTQLKWRLIDNQPKGVLLDTAHLQLKPSEMLIAPQMFGLVQPLDQIPKKNLIEDGAMSLGPGALQQGRISITSFYATKMITTGQGGAVLTDDDDLAAEVRDLISYDNRETYRQRFNYAPSDLGSALGRVQLRKLNTFLKQRQHLAKTYDAAFRDLAPQLLAEAQGLAQHQGLFRYWVKVSNLQTCIDHLRRANIESKSPVYQPLHRYFDLSASDFPHAEMAQQQILSLPFHPGLDDDDIHRVVRELVAIAEPTCD